MTSMPAVGDLVQNTRKGMTSMPAGDDLVQNTKKGMTSMTAGGDLVQNTRKGMISMPAWGDLVQNTRKGMTQEMVTLILFTVAKEKRANARLTATKLKVGIQLQLAAVQ